jgi:glyoxylase-like metal-dependent hydrolase (beta-lactamase superfamily II)
MLQLKKFIFNPFQVNTYILYDETGEAVIVDAACSNSDEERLLDHFISSNNLSPKLLLNTHGHVDHLMGISSLKRKYNIPFGMNSLDEFLIESAEKHGKMFGLSLEKPPMPDVNYHDGDSVSIGKSSLKCIHVPGHSPGSLVFSCDESGFLISGDVLFEGSIGRTDLPGGDYELLLTGIRDRLFSLDPGLKVYPGHGDATSIGAEVQQNPFFQ